MTKFLDSTGLSYLWDKIKALLSTKADKVSDATDGNFAGLDSTGNLTDSGHDSSELVPSGGTTGQVLAKHSNTDNDVEWITPEDTEMSISITYSDLVTLKAGGNLVSGMKYRITDYNTTVSEDLTDVSVAEHQFDVIVTALSESELDHCASAIQHEGDTYFSDCDLSKWKLWYDIENDTEKYSWAVGDSSSGNGGAKGSIPEYAPEYIIAGDFIIAQLDKAGLSHYLVFQGIETITLKEEVECYVYGTSVQATALGYTKIFCKEFPSGKTPIYATDDKGNISSITTVSAVSSSTQPTNGTKIIAKSVTSETTTSFLDKEGISPELEFNGRIVMYKGQNCYSYGSSAQYTALANGFGKVSDIIVTDGVSPIAPKKIEELGTNVVILDDEVSDPITAVSQETVVVGGNSGGTGVIYRMIDEWGNDCPYDFKNIMFKRKLTGGALDDQGTDTWCYTFNGYNSTESEYYDMSSHMFYISEQTRQDAIDDGDGTDECDMCHNNVILPAKYVDDLEYKDIKIILNDIVFLGVSFDDGYDNEYSVSYCFSNVFGNDCYGNTFGKNCYCNTFGSHCYISTFGNYCYSNTFGNYCYSNTFGNGCSSNSFGNNCYSNSFGNNCYSNSFGSSCYSNAFRNNCQNNSFGNNCKQNLFLGYFQNNSFGNDCYSNSVQNNCQSNSFGNNCNSNSFGNNYQYSSFGNYCNNNSFGNYCQNITVFDGVQKCNVTGGTSSLPVKNAQILNGTKGTSSSNKLTITFTANQNYTQVAGLVDGTTLRIWITEDTVTGPTTATNNHIAVFDGTTGKIIKDGGVTVEDLQVDVPEYTIEKLGVAETGYSSSYILKKDNVQVGDTINIPKDMVVSNGEVKTVTVANEPYQGAQVDDKYIDLTIANTSQNHIYIPVKDLVDVYTKGDGIDISNSNVISVAIDSNNANGLSVDANGVALATATTSSAGAMSAADKIKLNGIAAGAEVNVQSDWNQTDNTSDDFIKNKPIIPNLNNALYKGFYASGSNGSGILIKTTLRATSNVMPMFHIIGRHHSGGKIIDTFVTFYNYTSQNSSMYAPSLLHNGRNIGNIHAFVYNPNDTSQPLNGYIYIWIPTTVQYNTYHVYCRTYDSESNKVDSITKTGMFDESLVSRHSIIEPYVSAMTSDIPTVNNATLTITQGGVTKGTFTANASQDTTIDLSNGLTSVDWDDITNKPNFATVATSGSYNDLTDTPPLDTSLTNAEIDTIWNNAS